MFALKVEGLKKVYGSKVTALKGVDLSVADGDFFALLGPNGAGKTTFIGIVASLINKTAGRVQVFGYDLDTQKEDVKRQIGLVPQEFNFSIFEKVINTLLQQAGYYGIPRELAHQRAEKYLKHLELWDKRDAQVRELSGGMKRRLLIARALVHEPKLLILDEPTAGVDIEVRRIMWKFFREINEQGTTIILTTHYLEEAESLCRNIAIIDNGEIISNTSVNALLSELQMETFVLLLAEPLVDLPKIADMVVRRVDEKTLEIDIHHAQSINQVFEKLTAAGVHVASLRNKVNRLEEMFLNLTQKSG